MNELLLEALIDSARMIPFLLGIYFLVEWAEQKFGDSIEHRFKRATWDNPVLGALFGCIPQCGFSVVAASLYSRRLISTGTLLAVFLSTSDEAIPVLLSHPHQARTVAILLVTKLLIAVTAGTLIDRVFRRRQPSATETPETETRELGCCKHSVSGKTNAWRMLKHPLVHTAKIFVFIFVVTFSLNGLMAWVGEENFGRILLRNSLFQPFLAALVGLIPNCAASVVIAELFLKGGLSFGSTIAGLGCSGGLGLLVLLRENRNLNDTLRIIVLLVGISALAGLVIQFFCAGRG